MQLKFAFTIAPKFVPLLAPPPTKSGGARAHPDYMVPAPLVGAEYTIAVLG